MSNEIIRSNGASGLRVGHFEITANGLLIDGAPDYDEWERLGIALRTVERGIQFALGDWLNYGEHAYGQKYSQALEETEYEYETLRKYVYVAKRIETGNRFPILSFHHHMLIAPLDPDQQTYWLKYAAARDWSVADLRKALREHKKRQLVAQSDDAPENDILHGDLSLLYDAVPDYSVDMFFSDPPYHADSVDTFTELARLAAVKLRPGGLCLTYSGQMHLPQVMTAMSAHLAYWWVFALRHTGGHLTIWKFNLWNDWKPILVFAKPYADGTLPLAPEWVQDFLDGGGRDKHYHEWGQDADEATYWIEKLTEPNALICDPYVGGGAIPVACKLTGRRWIGTDIELENVLTTRNRLEAMNDSATK